MKLISQFLGRILVVLAALALLLGVVIGFETSSNNLFTSAISVFANLASELLDTLNGLEYCFH